MSLSKIEEKNERRYDERQIALETQNILIEHENISFTREKVIMTEQTARDFICCRCIMYVWRSVECERMMFLKTYPITKNRQIWKPQWCIEQQHQQFVWIILQSNVFQEHQIITETFTAWHARQTEVAQKMDTVFDMIVTQKGKKIWINKFKVYYFKLEWNVQRIPFRLHGQFCSC